MHFLSSTIIIPGVLLWSALAGGCGRGEDGDIGIARHYEFSVVSERLAPLDCPVSSWLADRDGLLTADNSVIEASKSSDGGYSVTVTALENAGRSRSLRMEFVGAGKILRCTGVVWTTANDIAPEFRARLSQWGGEVAACERDVQGLGPTVEVDLTLTANYFHPATVLRGHLFASVH